MRTVTLVLIVVGLLALALGGYLTPLFRTGLNPFVTAQRWLSDRYLAVYDFMTMPRDVATLRQRNVELEGQITELEKQVIELQQKVTEAQARDALLDFARKNTENQYAAATVIGRDPSPFLNYVIIDRGSDDGIRRGMPVVTQQGLVGRVDATTAVAARVQLITDASSAVNIRLQSSQVEATLVGSQSGEITLVMLPQDLKTSTGDLILTSGLGGNYPPNLFIGQVLNVREGGSSLIPRVTVQPVVDFQKLRVVLIITNFRPVDITPLIPTRAP